MTVGHDLLWHAQLIISALPWYGGLQLFGFCAWPFFFGVFNRLPDRGYAAAKAFGLLFVSYVTFMLAHNPGQGFTWETVALSLGFLACISLIRLPRTFDYLVEFVRYRWRVCAAYELVFFLGFVTMVLLRAQMPQITYEISDFAAEKFTDFAILNSVLTSRVFPPHDAWLSGFTLNYYYFGHFLWATVARFTGTSAAIAFNLALASIFAYVLLLATSLGYNVTAKLRWGLFCAFLVGLSSNLDGALQLLGIAQEIWDGNLSLGSWYLGYDFWRSSRAIANTINEFPAFSFLLGDLHAHLSSLVIFLAGLLLCLQAWRSVRRAGSLLRWELENLDELLFLAMIIGALYAANSWDSVPFAACVVASLWSAATSAISHNAKLTGNPRSVAGWRIAVFVESVLITAIAGMLGIVLLFRPYWLDFLPPNARLARVPSELLSSPVEFLVHWSLLLAPSLTVMWVLLRSIFLRSAFGSLGGGVTREKLWGFVALYAMGILLGVVSGFGIVGSVCLMSFFAVVYVVLAHQQSSVFRFWLSLLAVFSLLAAFCELYYFDDIFTGAIERINTVFKIYYGLWPIAAVAGTIAASRLTRYGTTRQRAVSRAGVLLLVMLGAVYPVSGTLQRLAMSKHYPRPRDPQRGLDGLVYLANLQPDDYAAILWLRAYTEPDARLVEAPGKQYEYAGRMATNTGRPSLGGWLYHEWGWRGNSFEIERDRRFQLADIIYSSPSLKATAEALLENRFAFVIVGQTERERFPLLNEEKFHKLGALAYRRGSTSIYRLSPAMLQATAESEELTTAPGLKSFSLETTEEALSSSRSTETAHEIATTTVALPLRLDERFSSVPTQSSRVAPITKQSPETTSPQRLAPVEHDATTSTLATDVSQLSSNKAAASPAITHYEDFSDSLSTKTIVGLVVPSELATTTGYQITSSLHESIAHAE
ncbi:MAG: DUF2298 domain-containing protein [Candidatus Sumerlaeaceae bacterium]|jgi:YYY domain-containing protein